jgi:hypothetical protein
MKNFRVATPAAGVRLACLAVIVSVLVCAVGASSSSPATETHGSLIELWDGTSWTQQASPNPNGTGSFSAASATSATDAWAVGTFFGDGEGALAAHWDGSSWQQVAMPAPADKFDFSGLAAISATDAWAVGWHGKRQFKAERPLIEHWNGSAWNIVPHPSPGRNALLNGVAAVSPRNVWAVGTYSAPYRDRYYRTLVLHWDGRTWKHIPSPRPGLRGRGGGSSLSGVAVVSANDVWAVGSYTPRPSNSGTYYWRTLVLHWDGEKWSHVPSTNPGGGRGFANALYGIAALGRNNVWAVGGNYKDALMAPLVEHWNGHSWRTVPTPSGFPQCSWQPLAALAPLTRNDIWAAGAGIGCGCSSEGCSSEQAFAEHWDGKVWSVSPVVKPPSSLFDAFYGIAAATPHAVWAVGRY